MYLQGFTKHKGFWSTILHKPVVIWFFKNEIIFWNMIIIYNDFHSGTCKVGDTWYVCVSALI